MEEKVSHKFEVKLKLTMNDVLMGYKGHIRPFDIIVLTLYHHTDTQ